MMLYLNPRLLAVMLVLISTSLLSACETFQLCKGKDICPWQEAGVQKRQCPAWPQIPAELVSVSSNESVAAKIQAQSRASLPAVSSTGR